MRLRLLALTALLIFVNLVSGAANAEPQAPVDFLLTPAEVQELLGDGWTRGEIQEVPLLPYGWLATAPYLHGSTTVALGVEEWDTEEHALVSYQRRKGGPKVGEWQDYGLIACAQFQDFNGGGEVCLTRPVGVHLAWAWSYEADRETMITMLDRVLAKLAEAQ